MNVAQHAEKILQAWTFADAKNFEVELESAFQSCSAASSTSRLEREQQEVLQGVVERLRYLHEMDAERTHTGTNGAFVLLRHLQRGNRSGLDGLHQKTESVKSERLKFGTKRPKCSVEVD